jgi:hypothetical protein
MTECRAREEGTGKLRKQHKPVSGTYDEKPIVTCAWCGAMLFCATFRL